VKPTRSSRRFTVVFLCCTACGAPATNANSDAGPDTIAPGEAGPVVDAAAAHIEIGTGDPGSFRTVTDGQQVLLQRGCQGAQHIFFALRWSGIASAEPPWITLTVVRDEDEMVVSSPYSLRLAPMTIRDGLAEITGLTPVIEEPRLVVGQRVRMRARVEDSTRSTRVESERRVDVQWGPDSCRPHG
jgi:hypothetical protein